MRRHRGRKSGLHTIIRGLAAGCVGTAVMTIAMEAMFHRLPRREQAPLPPRQLTMAMADRVGLARHLDERQRLSVALAAHFAYGSVVGALYGPLMRGVPGASVFKGSLFGLGVWGVSYLGWIPALRLLPSATHWPHRRNALMLITHFVWGSTIAWQIDRSRRRRQ